MKITIGSFTFDVLLFIRVCLPATVFIGVCTGVLLVFNLVLRTVGQIAPSFIGVTWLSLLIFYIMFGIAFTRFAAKFLRDTFSTEGLHVQRRMALLSGAPFYALCSLCLLMTIYSFYDPDVSGASAFVSLVGFVLFAMASGGYLTLVHFFLGRPVNS